MKYWLSAFAAGILSASLLTALPSLAITAVACGILIPPLCLAVRKFADHVAAKILLTCTTGLLLGLAYGIVVGHKLVNQQLPEKLAGQPLWVEGRVVGLPQLDERRQLFELEVISARMSLQTETLNDFSPRKILVSSYGQLRVKTGETWQLHVKLKAPRGFVNPGGFDYQASLLRRGVGATGYVRDSIDNRLLGRQPTRSLEVLRYQLQQWLLTHSHNNERAILIALLVGDTSLVTKEQWGELTKTGTNHLIAISGLHLGFFAIAGFFLGELIGRFIQLIWHRCPAAVPGHLFAMAFTLFYSLIAGMNIPTLRTLIMLAVVHAACLSRRSFRISDIFLLALVCVLLYDSLAAFDIGFWLSFGAVAVLLFCFSGRLQPNRTTQVVIVYLKEFLKSQWIMFIGLLIPLALLVNTSSLLAPAANLLAIPLITFFVVPCLIIAAICQQLLGYSDTIFLWGAEQGTQLFSFWLHYLLSANLDQLNPVISLNRYAIPLALLGVFLLLLPKGLRKSPIGILSICMALAIPVEPENPLQLLVFDVGQGTAVLVRTKNHQLLYDTGPIFTDNFDAGSGILTPYLRRQGLRRLDAVVVSHMDADHSGGMEAILNNFTINNLWLGEPEKYTAKAGQPKGQNCHERPAWWWDDVSFRFIKWKPLSNTKSNNRSCVLLVEYQTQKILLTGDIEKPVEKELLNEEALEPVDILLAPHHGSHSSSTPVFVAKTYPKYVIYSAGYRNQHGHPHKEVRQRYQRINTQELNTASSGALEFSWEHGQLEIIEYRRAQKRFWFTPDADL